MKCPCCGNEICALKALLEFLENQETTTTEEKS